jgi:Tfp pilus assembly protein PilF
LEATPKDGGAKAEQAEALAARSLGLDETVAEAHTVLAGVNTIRKDFAAAEREHRRALELNPDFATGRVRYGHFLTMSLRLPEGLREMRRAQELDPLSPVTNGALAFMLLMSREYDEAIK